MVPQEHSTYRMEIIMTQQRNMYSSILGSLSLVECRKGVFKTDDLHTISKKNESASKKIKRDTYATISVEKGTVDKTGINASWIDMMI